MPVANWACPLNTNWTRWRRQREVSLVTRTRRRRRLCRLYPAVNYCTVCVSADRKWRHDDDERRYRPAALSPSVELAFATDDLRRRPVRASVAMSVYASVRETKELKNLLNRKWWNLLQATLFYQQVIEK